MNQTFCPSVHNVQAWVLVQSSIQIRHKLKSFIYRLQGTQETVWPCLMLNINTLQNIQIRKSYQYFRY